MWIIFFVENLLHFDLRFLGVLPRSIPGAIGILTAPLIHADLAHLISNTLPLLFLGSVLFFFFPNKAASVFFNCFYFTNILVWIFSPRIAYHIGASGLIYGLAAFLIMFGIFTKNVTSLLISIGVFVMFGGIFYGILPNNPTISWESHLAGTIVGIATAYNYKKCF